MDRTVPCSYNGGIGYVKGANGKCGDSGCNRSGEKNESGEEAEMDL